MVHILRKFIKPFWWWGADTRIGEVVSALGLWAWTITLLHPNEMFAQTWFRHFAAIISESSLGLILGSVAILQSIAMCGNVYLFRLPSALFAMIAYMFMSAVLFQTSQYTPGTYIYALLAMVNMYAIVQGPTKNK